MENFLYLCALKLSTCCPSVGISSVQLPEPMWRGVHNLAWAVLTFSAVCPKYVCNVNTILVMCLWSCGMLSTVMQVLSGGDEGRRQSVFGLKDYVVLIR